MPRRTRAEPTAPHRPLPELLAWAGARLEPPRLPARLLALAERPGVRRLRALVLRRRRELLALGLAAGILLMVIHWA